MISQLARFTDIRAALVVGGLSLQKQATELRAAPEIVVATPGRVIDHVMNTMSFELDSLAVLILDEADRLLELGFQAEVCAALLHISHNTMHRSAREVVQL
jgi:ATP-dependent RNA helicase DDX27